MSAELRKNPTSFSGKLARALHTEEGERRRRPTLSLPAVRGVPQQLFFVFKGTLGCGIQQSLESITYLRMVLGVEQKSGMDGAMIKLWYNKLWEPHL